MKTTADTAETCPGDNTLAALVDGGLGREPSLLEHLSRCSACQELVAELLRDGNEADARYDVEGLLGTGGMGLVVRAHDTVLHRPVALKVLWRTDGACGGSAEAVLAEARTLARFDHPNVVTVHDAGVLPRVGAPFIAMELVEGQTLRQWLTVEHPWRDVVRVFVEAGRGLAAAHALGIVHADFKPANVLLPSGGGRARVTDFGLARAMAPNDEAADTFGAGTPRYMAPEHRLGQPDARSDQFAFGVALHEALWGRHPYKDIPCPAVGAPGAPAWLRRVVDRCIHEEPKRRHASMDAVLRELEGPSRPRAMLWLAGLGLVAVPALWWAMDDGCVRQVEERRARWEGELRPALGEALDDEAWARIEPGTNAWVDEWVVRAEQACRDGAPTATRGCLDERWATLEVLSSHVLEGGDATRAAGPLALAQLPSVGSCRRPDPGTAVPEVAAQQLEACAEAIANGRASLLLGDASAAETALVEAASKAESAGLLGMEAEARNLLARSLWQSGKPDEAFDEFSRTSVIAVRAELPDVAATAMGETARFVVVSRRDTDLARHWLAQARAQASLGVEPITEINLDRVDAWIRHVDGESEDAIGIMQGAMARANELLPERALGRATNREDLAVMLERAGQSDAALSEIAAAIELRSAVLGPMHPTIARSRQIRATILQDQGRPAEAAEELETAIASLLAAHGPDSPAAALASLLRADNLMDAGQFDAAAETLELPKRVYSSGESRDAMRVGLTQQMLARLDVGQGRPQQAIERFEALLDERTPARLSELRRALIHRDVGLALLALGRRQQAAASFRKALASPAFRPSTRDEIEAMLAKCETVSAPGRTEPEAAVVGEGAPILDDLEPSRTQPLGGDGVDDP